MPLCSSQQVEGAAHAAQHAEAQHVDLHELQRVDVVLVPFDDLPVLHRGRLDRHELVEPVLGQDEAARMLREVARRADQLAGELQRQAQAAVVEVEVELARPRFSLDALRAPAPDLAGRAPRSRPPAGPAPCRPRAPRRGRGSGSRSRSQRGAVAAVGLVDPLDHLLAPLVLEVDVDVGRLAALLGDEALEQQVVLRSGSIEVMPST